MNIFDLRQNLIGDYSSYIKSFIQIRNQRIQNYVEQALFQQGSLWPEPLIQLNPMFEPGNSLDEMVARDVLHPACAPIFRRGKKEVDPRGHPLQLYKHQEQAIEVARQGHSYILTTGTGSGKSLAYIIPIIDYVLRHPEKQGIKAIVVYPMNALANSQLGELQKYLDVGYPSSVRQIKFRRYTGQEKYEERDEIIADPPDILLTNYVMLELIMTRLRERRLINAAQLRFLVLDELHTYRGRQGSDIALLVRRVRNRLVPAGETLQCVGTSATLASGGNYFEQQQEIAMMASGIFGCDVAREHVIGETLMRVTDEVDETAPAFRQSLTERVTHLVYSIPQNYDAFIHDPLSIWLESTFGVTRPEPSARLVRTKPCRISGEEESAATTLQQLTGVSEQEAIAAIKQGLLVGYEQIKHPQTGRAPFAFRLHQFISKGDTVYATLEYDPQRHITLQYQQYAPGGRERVLLPLVFCRECGQEYYCVRWLDEQTLIGREVQDQLRYTDTGDDKSSGRTGKPGFLFIDPDEKWPRDREGIEQLLPDEWKEIRNGRERLISSARKNMPQPLQVHTGGTVIEQETEGTPCYFIPAPFRFCLHCGVSYSTFLDSDFEKLAQLSSEGRSTATTILSLSAIRQLRDARERGEELTIEPKMLSFTDNRQDASLQAGHFNDFTEIGLLRSALYCAAKSTGDEGLRHDNLALKVFEALRLDPDKYAVNKELKYSAKIKTEQALRNVLGYRLYLDLRRGWRITSPNLEQSGLLEIEYEDLTEICADDDLWQQYHEILRTTPAATRYLLCRTLLDYMRRELAIKVDYLNYIRQEEYKQQSAQHLIAPWGIDEDEEMTHATRLFPRKRVKEDYGGERYLSGFSSYGRYIRRTLRNDHPHLRTDQTQLLIQDLLAGLKTTGLIEEVIEARNGDDAPGYQLLASALIWRAGDGSRGYHDPLRTPNLSQVQETKQKRVNKFFVNFYQENAAELQRLQDIRAAEHTAQVPADRREDREKKFRAGRLPILYCSPTMELGVDIAELNIVNMRNIPPTPANYAQRSGRAGRSGQPALVFSYCSTGSSHDQYFFQHSSAMVSGAVTPPRLDLSNEDLIRAHVHAIWLNEIGLPLGDSLKDLLDIAGNEPTLAIKKHVIDALRDVAAREQAERRARDVLQTLEHDLTESKAPWFLSSWLSDVLNNLEKSFDAACSRWRGLYHAAQDQRDTQNAIIKDASRSEDDKKQAKRLRSEAEAQLELLTASNSIERSDLSEFYSYRYFASEGFLPGYNFPRLPLSAYIPARRSKQRDEYLSRPRFLAIAEFAPRAIIYHEGSRYIINRSILSVREDSSGILTTAIKQCSHCGYLHPLGEASTLDVCIRCGKLLPTPLSMLFQLQNVSTRRRDKINSDEEERLRQGYDIRTGVRFPPRQDGRPASFVAYVEDAAGQRIARLTYGQAAMLWRINFGPVRRKDKGVHGFLLDTERGYWGKDDESKGDPDDPMSDKKVRVIPYVADTRNCLLFEPLDGLEDVQMVTLQAALKRGIQMHYQLEDNELAAEPLPGAADRRLLLFYEASEGGAGVLRQLIDMPYAIREVARAALQRCHFDPETGEDLRKVELALEDCEAACYHCLMSYTNQRDHRQLDRQRVKDYLWQLKTCRATLSFAESEPPSLLQGQFIEQADGTIEHEWLQHLRMRGFSPRASLHALVAGCEARPDFLYEDVGVAIYVDGSAPERQARDSALTEELENRGYMVLRFKEQAEWDNYFTKYADLFRREV